MAVSKKKSPLKSRKYYKSMPNFVGKAYPQYVNDDYNVYDAALDRIRWLFDEFNGNVMVTNSGGKDSTIVVELAAKVAKEKGCGPLRVHWLDQEMEFETTVEYQRYIMYERDDIDFHWYQIPFRLDNATNHDNPYVDVWSTDPEVEWVREKEPESITENTYGQIEFNELLSAIAVQDLGPEWCILDGMRTEESPSRRLLMTSRPMYKWVTWSNADCDPPSAPDWDSCRMRFHPIYDWSYRDVWKAIYDNEWKYNRHYDHLFQHGVRISNMRVSNYHHESALSALHWLQELEPETWERATSRLAGISTYGHLKETQFPDSLPYMFKSWDEYVRYLIDNLVGEEHRDTFLGYYDRVKRSCPHMETEELAKFMVVPVIKNDLYGVAVKNFLVSHRPGSNVGKPSDKKKKESA